MNNLESFDNDAGNSEAVKALVDAGADVSLAAVGGVTPLHAAAERGGLDLVHLLLKVLPFGHAVPFVSLHFACLLFAVTSLACLLLWHLPFQVVDICLPFKFVSAFSGDSS